TFAEQPEYRDLAIRHRLVELQHLAAVSRSRPHHREGELATREALLDELADLVLEQAHQLGSPERHLAVAMVDRPNLGAEPLAVALQFGRSVPGHASN